jgi:ABC-type transport system involved in cytochrome c biogenesis permease subunit
MANKGRALQPRFEESVRNVIFFQLFCLVNLFHIVIVVVIIIIIILFLVGGWGKTPLLFYKEVVARTKGSLVIALMSMRKDSTSSTKHSNAYMKNVVKNPCPKITLLKLGGNIQYTTDNAIIF